MRELTPEERQRVTENRKDTGSLPRYLDPDTGEELPISREFEAWLILTPVGVRANISQWLMQLARNTPHDVAFDDLAMEFMEEEEEIALAENNEYDSSLSGYDQFRTSLNVDGFQDVTELSILLAQTTSGLGRIGAARSSAVFAYSMALVNKAEMESRRVDENTRRSLRAWTQILLAYT